MKDINLPINQQAHTLAPINVKYHLAHFHLLDLAEHLKEWLEDVAERKNVEPYENITLSKDKGPLPVASCN